MKTLVLGPFEPIPPAGGPLCPDPVACGWVKMRRNKLGSIQSCEFWQKLNKMEEDRCDE